MQVWQHLTTVHQINTKDSKRRGCYTISVVVLNSFKIVKKGRKLKKGEQDDNTIAQMAALSLLALVNGLDESNKFNQLDKCKITCQNLLLSKTERLWMIMLWRKKPTKKTLRKKTSSANTDDLIDSSSSSEDKKKTPLKGLKKQKLYDMSSSDSDNE